VCRGKIPLDPLIFVPKIRKDMAKTSINVQPVKSSSEAHNLREKPLDYVMPELTSQNETWQADTIAHRLEVIQDNYFETVGQRMQEKATPIREGVVVIEPTTTMKELQDFTQKIEDRFGIKAFQIHIHRDEGTDEKINHHAHIVFDWTQDNGKSIKMNKQDMSEMQTILATALRMDRGENSDVQHLNAIQYKNKLEEERAKALQLQILELEKQIKSKSIINDTKGFLGASMDFIKSKTDKSPQEEIKTLKTQINELSSNVKALNNTIQTERTEFAAEKKALKTDFTTKINDLQGKYDKDVTTLNGKIDKMKGNEKKIIDFIKSVGKEVITIDKSVFQNHIDLNKLPNFKSLITLELSNKKKEQEQAQAPKQKPQEQPKPNKSKGFKL